MRFIRFAAVSVVLVCVFGTRTAQAQDPSLAASIVSVADAGYPHAQAVISTVDSSAETPAAYGPSNFAVTIDGAPATVTAAELAKSEDAPLYVLFVIDTSGSMDGAPIAAAKAAARAFVEELHPNDHVGVMHFGNTVSLRQDFTNDRALIDAAIGDLVAEGNTALYQATADGARIIAAAPSVRRAVVLLSDGADFGGKSIATRDEAIFTAGATGVPYFVIAQGTDLDRPYLQQLAGVTRGRYLEAPQPHELEALYVGIGRMLSSQYLVTFDASGATPGAASTVSVTVSDGSRASAPSEMSYTPAASFLPEIMIQGLQAGERVEAARELSLSISDGAPRVTWYVDDVNVAVNDGPPYTFTFDPAQYAEGAHRLKVSFGAGASPVEEALEFTSVPPVPQASGGGPSLLLIICGVVAVATAIAAVFWFSSRGRKKEAGISPDQRLTPWAAQVAKAQQGGTGSEPDDGVVPEDIGEPLGVLVTRAGSESGTEYVVGGKPVGIGAGLRCGVRINDPELSFEEARVWVRGEHLMLRKKTRLSRMETTGEVGGWQILGAGDTFSVGRHTFEFRLLETDIAPHLDASVEGPATPPADIPNVLREPPQPPPAPRFSDLMPRND